MKIFDFTQNEISCKHLLTVFLGLWCLLWAFEGLIALNICNYSCFLSSNCYVIVIEKNESYMIRAFEKKSCRTECESESFESWSENYSEHILYIKNNKRVMFCIM